MNIRWKNVELMLLLSALFTLVLIGARIMYTGKWDYFMFSWNLFLGSIPVLFSRTLGGKEKLNVSAVAALTGWILFLPNAPYLITDIFHFRAKTGIPKWYDLMLVVSAAWNGLMFAVVSLLQVEEYLSRFLNRLQLQAVMVISIFSCSFGIYLGRYLRFNSWDVITDPIDLVLQIARRICYPQQHGGTWAFTAVFGVMLCLAYYTIRNLGSILKPAKQ